MTRSHSIAYASPADREDSSASSDSDEALRASLAWIEVENFTFGEFKQGTAGYLRTRTFPQPVRTLGLTGWTTVVRVPFHRNQTIRIGRDTKKCNLRIKNETVSPVHCEIYSVLFDRNEQRPPLIYARDCQSASGTYVNGQLIGQGPFVTAGRLLEDNDTISVGPCSLRLCDYSAPASDLVLSAAQREEASMFADLFKIKDTVIGYGAFADVYLALDIKTSKQLVCKVHDLALLKSRDKAAARRVDREMAIWSQLDHPNIISFHRAFRTKTTMFTFAELASGGDLFSLLQREESIPELEIKWIVTQILRAVDYLHRKGVAHRDIKPENVLCSVSPHMYHRVVLADFGCAGVTSLGRMTSNVGTNSYQAPEVQLSEGSHGTAVDIWAIGILTLQLLTGNEAVEMPATFQDTSEVSRFVRTVNLRRVSKVAALISQEGLDFIVACLNLDPTRRPTATRASKHVWFNSSEKERTLFKERQRQSSWKPRDIVIPAIVDLRGASEKRTETDRSGMTQAAAFRRMASPKLSGIAAESQSRESNNNEPRHASPEPTQPTLSDAAKSQYQDRMRLERRNITMAANKRVHLATGPETAYSRKRSAP